MRVKTTDSFKKKVERVEWLKKNSSKIASGILKSNGLALIEMFRAGVDQNQFGLTPLKDNTVLSKKSAGYDHPDTPLVGKGDRRKGSKDSYENMLRLKRVPQGWSVVVSSGKHWSGAPLKMLYVVHEYGMKIVKKDGTIIQIPKRPALKYAVREFKASLKESFGDKFGRMTKGFITRGSWKKELDRAISLTKSKNEKEEK